MTPKQTRQSTNRSILIPTNKTRRIVLDQISQVDIEVDDGDPKLLITRRSGPPQYAYREFARDVLLSLGLRDDARLFDPWID